MNSLTFVPNSLVQVFQNLEVKSLSLSDMMLCGIPWLLTISFSIAFANLSANFYSLHGINCAFLVSWSMTTKMLS